MLAIGLLAVLTAQASAQLGRMDLVTAIELGLVQAEFRGNGDESIVGLIARGPNGPKELVLEPGTQFWAQLGGGGGFGQGGFGQGGRRQGGFGQGGFGQGGFGQGGLFQGGGGQRGGGIQGMGALEGGTIDMGEAVVQITIPTACTNIGLRAPRRGDILIATRCPDQRVARVAALAKEPGVAYPTVQVAVWAVANNAPREAIEMYVRKLVKAERKKNPEAEVVTIETLLGQAQALLRKAKVDAAGFAMFE